MVQSSVYRGWHMSTFEELIHFLSECILTRQLRENLIIDLRHLFGIAFETEFSALESYAWTLNLLGSPIAPCLEWERKALPQALLQIRGKLFKQLIIYVLLYICVLLLFHLVSRRRSNPYYLSYIHCDYFCYFFFSS